MKRQNAVSRRRIPIVERHGIRQPLSLTEFPAQNPQSLTQHREVN
jgi:hypothetical protein